MASSSPTEPSAFDRWLQNGLVKQHAEILREPLPEEWLALLAAPPEG